MNRAITIRDVLALVSMAVLLMGQTYGNGGPGVTADGTTILNTGGVLSLNGAQPNAQTWGNFFNVAYNAATACNGGATSAPTSPVCIVSTATVGLGLSNNNGTWTGTGNSLQLNFYKGGNPCGLVLNSSGILIIGNGAGCNSVSTAGNSFSTGAGSLTTGKILQNAAGLFAGSCATATTTCTSTGAASFTTPLCWAQDVTGFIVAHCTETGTTVTVTAASSSTDTFNWHLIPNPT